MDREQLSAAAEALLAGRLSIADFVGQLASIADVGEAQVDVDRQRRCGFPEVVYGPGKTIAALEKIFHALLASGAEVLATRISPEQAAGLEPQFPAGRYNALARTFRVAPTGPTKRSGRRMVMLPWSRLAPAICPSRKRPEKPRCGREPESRWFATWAWRGPSACRPVCQKLPAPMLWWSWRAWKGRLPSVVGGYVDCPVIAVPTSVGYGANLGGISALLSMLNSCAANVTVVNIDAGFKGGYLAGLIARNVHRGRSQA